MSDKKVAQERFQILQQKIFDYLNPDETEANDNSPMASAFVNIGADSNEYADSIYVKYGIHQEKARQISEIMYALSAYNASVPYDSKIKGFNVPITDIKVETFAEVDASFDDYDFEEPISFDNEIPDTSDLPTARTDIFSMTIDEEGLSFDIFNHYNDDRYFLKIYHDDLEYLSYGPEIEQLFANKEFCLKEVQTAGKKLQYVPEELRDREMCLTAVQQDGRALQYVPEEQRDREMCMAAVRQTGWAFQYVPDAIRGDATTADEFLERAEDEDTVRPSM